MSRFYIGQRVKKARGEENIGLTGTVVGTDLVPRYGRVFKESDLQVRFDTPWVNSLKMLCPVSIVALGLACNFEPILPDGLESEEEIKKLYEPTEGVTS